MSRKKISDDKKKAKTAISIDEKLFKIMEDYLNENDFKRSKYIEKLIREDMERRGIQIDKQF